MVLKEKLEILKLISRGILFFVALTILIPTVFPQAIIIDHDYTDLGKISPYWIEETKLLTLHYAHTSYDSQIITGILNLESLDPTTHSVAVRESATAGLPRRSTPASTGDCEFSMWAWCWHVPNASYSYIVNYCNGCRQ